MPSKVIDPETARFWCALPAELVRAPASPVTSSAVAPAAAATTTMRVRIMRLLSYCHCRRRCQAPSAGSKKCSDRVSTATSMASPGRTRERAPKRPTSVAVSLSAASSIARSSPTSCASSRTSSVVACFALIVKWAMISEPSASVSAAVPRSRCSFGEPARARRPRGPRAGCRARPASRRTRRGRGAT